jgi:hypothetical protein
MSQPEVVVRKPVVWFLNSLAGLLRELADELDAAPPDPSTLGDGEADILVPKVRGWRQQQIVELPGMRTAEGLRTSEIAQTIDYDQPNVWSTLKVLATDAIVEQVPTPGPQRWRLTARYRRT